MATVIELTYTKSTKNKHVYKDISENPAIESVYISRDVLPDKPETITLTLESK